MLLGMAPFMRPVMAPRMLLHMTPLMLQQGATYADIAAHGVIHVVTNGVTHAAAALQRQNTEILKEIFLEKEYRGLSPNFHIHASVSDLYISTIGLPIQEEICRPIYVDYINRSQTHECGNRG